MRCTENETLPIFWPDINWLDDWHSAERSDFTAETFISAELSNNLLHTSFFINSSTSFF